MGSKATDGAFLDSDEDGVLSRKASDELSIQRLAEPGHTPLGSIAVLASYISQEADACKEVPCLLAGFVSLSKPCIHSGSVFSSTAPSKFLPD